ALERGQALADHVASDLHGPRDDRRGERVVEVVAPGEGEVGGRHEVLFADHGGGGLPAGRGRGGVGEGQDDAAVADEGAERGLRVRREGGRGEPALGGQRQGVLAHRLVVVVVDQPVARLEVGG